MMSERSRGAIKALKGCVDEEEAGAGVTQDVADLLRVEARVDRDQDAARGGHGEVRLDHRRDVGAQERDPVVLTKPRCLQGGGEAIDPLRKRAVVIGGATIAVHDGGLVGEDRGATTQKAERGELGAGDCRVADRWDGSNSGLGKQCGHSGSSFGTSRSGGYRRPALINEGVT